MHWKVILSLFLVLLLVGVVFTTGFGRGYADFLGNTVGRFVETFDLFEFSFSSDKAFSIFLSSDRQPYYGTKFSGSNSSLISNAICVSDIRVNDLNLRKANSQCDISLYDAKGTFELTRAGSLVVSVQAASVFVDGTEISPGNIRVEAELIPTDLILTEITNNRISLAGVDGDLIVFAADGNPAQTNPLTNETLTISNFVGSLYAKGSEVNLQGFVSAVESSIFKIPK